MASRPPAVIDSVGKVVALGSLLGTGGEGAVFDVKSSPKLVAKVYHKPLAPDRAAKISLMPGLANDALRKLTAWPIDLLRLQGTGAPIGLILPKVVGSKDIHQLYGPKSRRSEFQRADWRFLIRAATNTARAFGAVHDAGCVIGDVNHGGVLVSQDATVTMIDCDSFQVEVGGNRYLCKVGVETFTPPELHGRSFENVLRTADHDAFGLAVMTFLLLFMGRHPFAGRFLGAGDMPIAMAIEQGRFRGPLPFERGVQITKRLLDRHSPSLDAEHLVAGSCRAVRHFPVAVDDLELGYVSSKLVGFGLGYNNFRPQLGYGPDDFADRTALCSLLQLFELPFLLTNALEVVWYHPV